MYQAGRKDETAARSKSLRKVGPMVLAAVVVALATLLLGTAQAPPRSPEPRRRILRPPIATRGSPAS